ncbi:MAG: hypothetical protein RLZZ612_965 [Pseudomonadota bacterium]|jgi:hypothetical protein
MSVVSVVQKNLLVCACMLVLGGCGDQAAVSEQKPGAVQSPAFSGTGNEILSAVGGLQVEQVRRYLQSVEETKAQHLELKWSPAVVKIDREAAIRSLKAVSRHGANFVFDAQEPGLAALQKGSVLFIWGIAIRKVTAIKTKGAYTLVQTQPVALTEALTDAKIHFTAPLSFKHAFISQHPKGKNTPTVQPARFDPVRSAGPHGFLSVGSDDVPPDLADEGVSEDESAADVEQTPKSSFSGKVGGFDYEVAYTIAGTQLKFDLEARKAVGNLGADQAGQDVQKGSDVAPKDNKFATRLRAQTVSTSGSLVKGLFAQGYDDIDIRLKVQGALDGLSENGAMRIGNKIEIVDSRVQLLNTEFQNLSGNVSVDAIARLGDQQGTFHHNFKVLDVPVTFDIPFVLAGIPMVAQVGFNFLVQVGLNGKHAALHTSGAVQFKGNGSAKFSGGTIDNSGSAESEPQLGKKSAISPGVSGFVVAVQVPKVGVGLGFTTANIMSYVDHVSVLSIVNTAALASVVQCERYSLSSTVHAGVAANFNPLPIKIPGMKKEYQKQLFTKDQVISIPPTKACS